MGRETKSPSTGHNDSQASHHASLRVTSGERFVLAMRLRVQAWEIPFDCVQGRLSARNERRAAGQE